MRIIHILYYEYSVRFKDEIVVLEYAYLLVP
jgi:hypothetical protein